MRTKSRDREPDEEDDGPDVRATWAVRWRRQMVMGVVVLMAFVPVIGVVVAYEPDDPPKEIQVPLYVALGVVLAGALAFSLWNWRCPACHRYMGKRAFGLRFCAGCGARLG